jgi:predicted RecB family nuclease
MSGCKSSLRRDFILLRPLAPSTSIDVIKCLSTDDQEKKTQFIPYSFLWANKLSRTDKLLLAYNAHVLAKLLRRSIGSSKIIHGDRQISTKVKTADFAREVNNIIGKITAILIDAFPPKLALNRHCPECEFRERCHKLAIEKDDLSLLNGLSDKERAKLNSKGIFSVTQLSFTFRSRRRFKRHVGRPEKCHHSLKALSIREQKIHIVGRPQLIIEGTPVFLDVEGLPDREFYYLIGVRLKTMDGIVQHRLWADDNVAEKTIWVNFLSILSEIERPVLIHYGSFETTFLKKMCDRYGGASEGSTAQTAIKSSINLLSVIYAQIYFPVHYNGLKEIAKYLGFNWADPLASGLQSLVWRYQWEQSHDFELREKLIRYNTDDCEALALLTDALVQYLECERGTNHTQSHAPNIVYADFLKDMTNKWKTFKSPILGFEQINSAAHWDYQQDRVYARIQ